MARQPRTFLDRPRKVRKRRPPRCHASSIEEVAVRCLSWRRLRNSTWQSTHYALCHGTRTVLAETPLPSRAARRDTWGKATALSCPECSFENLFSKHAKREAAFRSLHMTRRAARLDEGLPTSTVHLSTRKAQLRLREQLPRLGLPMSVQAPMTRIPPQLTPAGNRVSPMRRHVVCAFAGRVAQSPHRVRQRRGTPLNKGARHLGGLLLRSASVMPAI